MGACVPLGAPPDPSDGYHMQERQPCGVVKRFS